MVVDQQPPEKNHLRYKYCAKQPWPPGGGFGFHVVIFIHGLTWCIYAGINNYLGIQRPEQDNFT
jgi:hypothetical protein